MSRVAFAANPGASCGRASANTSVSTRLRMRSVSDSSPGQRTKLLHDPGEVVDSADAPPRFRGSVPRRPVGCLLHRLAAGAVIGPGETVLQVTVDQSRGKLLKLKAGQPGSCALSLYQQPILLSGVPNRRGHLHGSRVEPFDSLQMLDCAVAEAGQTRKLATTTVEIVPPGDPVRSLDKLVGVSLHASHASGECAR